MGQEWPSTGVWRKVHPAPSAMLLDDSPFLRSWFEEFAKPFNAMLQAREWREGEEPRGGGP